MYALTCDGLDFLSRSDLAHFRGLGRNFVLGDGLRRGILLYRRPDFEYRLLGWLFVATLTGNGLTRVNLAWGASGRFRANRLLPV